MPRRKRSKSPSASRPSSPADSSSTPTTGRASSNTDDAIGRFASALRASEQREQAQRERQRAEREHAETLADARAALERAIEVVRTARRTGSGGADADTAWRVAKARVIELETGAPPEWAGPARPADPSTEPSSEPFDDQPADASGDVPDGT